MRLLCGEFVPGAHWTDRHVEDRARDRGADDVGTRGREGWEESEDLDLEEGSPT